MRLHETETRGIFTADISGAPAVVVLTTRDREKVGAVNTTICISPARIMAAQKLAHDTGELYVAVVVSVRREYKQSWAVTYDLFKKYKQGDSNFSLTETARKAYAGDKATVSAFKPQITAAKNKAHKSGKPVVARQKPTKATERKAKQEEEQATRNRNRLDKEFGPIATSAQPASPAKE